MPPGLPSRKRNHTKLDNVIVIRDDRTNENSTDKIILNPMLKIYIPGTVLHLFSLLLMGKKGAAMPNITPK